MPEKWFNEEYAPRRRKCRVPEDITFQTKPEITAEMLGEVIFSPGCSQVKWIGCDSLFGASKAFLDGLPKGCHYFADIHAPTPVWRERPEVVLPEFGGKG